MATWDDVARLALALPETNAGASGGRAQWRVRDKLIVWERPLRRGDLEALGDRAPSGPILGVRTENLLAKEALLAENPDVCFTTPHFDGYPAVLVKLEHIALDELAGIIEDAWLAKAPKRLVKEYLASRA